MHAKSAVRRRIPVIATALGLALLPVAAPAVAAGAGKHTADATLPELVIPGQPKGTARTEELLAAGPQGFLHKQRDNSYAWTRYDGSGTVKVADDTITPRTQYSYGAGSDTALVATAYVQNNPPWTLKNMVTGATTVLRPPAPPANSMYSLEGTYGEAAVAEILDRGDANSSGLTPTGLVVIRAAADGSTTSTPVTGWPGGTFPARLRQIGGDATTAAFGFSDPDGKFRISLVDTRTGVVTVSPAEAPADPAVSGCMDFFQPRATLGQDKIAYVGNDCNVHVLSRTDLAAPEKVVTFGYPNQPGAIALVGDTLVAVTPTNAPYDPNATATNTVKAYPLDGGAPTTLLPYAAATLAQAPDGSVLVEGGKSSTDWLVRRLSPGTATPVATGYRINPDAYDIDSLSLAKGALVTAETNGAKGMGFYRQQLTLGSTPAAGDRSFMGREGGQSSYGTCGNQACKQLLGTGDGRTVLLDRIWDSSRGLNGPVLATMSADGTTSAVAVDGGASQLVDAFGHWALVGVGTPDWTGSAPRATVVDLDTGSALPAFDRKPAALGKGVLYTTTATAGEIAVTDLATQQQRTFQTGSGCALTDLKASADWLYWSCGSGAPTGVQDSTGQTKLTVPAGAFALGNGFALYGNESAGTTSVVDFHTGTATTSTVSPYLRPDGYWAPWTVDKFGGSFAYRDAQQSVHVFSVYAPQAGDVFTAVDPNRLLDTRSAIGVSTTTKLPTKGTLSLQIAGRGTIPTGIKAVALNITVTQPDAPGYLTAWADGTNRPTSSNLNWTAGQTIPNLVIVPVGADGKVNLYNGSWAGTHLVADVFGYYSDSIQGSRFTAVDPNRLLDTRSAIGVSTTTKLPTKGTLSL
ncbi:hypothetical protein ABT095_22525, partial [Kitasatospora sp. NPDC002227]|uniref:hypothetical protein n=1 Tax=Kitasatospora sp. NPDC002227 TaxID=3154773 RepID=UPI00332465E9